MFLLQPNILMELQRKHSHFNERFRQSRQKFQVDNQLQVPNLLFIHSVSKRNLCGSLVIARIQLRGKAEKVLRYERATKECECATIMLSKYRHVKTVDLLIYKMKVE